MLINKIETIVKKSKFIAYHYKVNNADEVKEILESIKIEHKKAKHYPYAYIINNNIKKSDDKEPSNSAGTPILKILEENKLNNDLIIVVRYFGGIRLGVGGLYRAYLKSAIEVIKKSLN